MKSTFLKLLATSFFIIQLAACNNEKKEEKTTTDKTETPAKEDPKKTEVSVGPDGAEIKTKNGEEVKVGESGGSVGTKDVKIRINTKDTTKN